MDPLIAQNITILTELCRKFSVEKMYLFGSASTNSLEKNSDLDFLISFKKDLSPLSYSDNYFTLHQELEKLFNSEIDLVTENSLSNPYFIEGINETKQLIYDEKAQEISA
ncbi:MAG: nucleotidyltransferase domain-containing protein [Gracilimonas sp.]